MNRQLMNALENCLQAINDGEALDSILERYPHLAADLRPLLEAAQMARTLRPGPGQAVNRSPVPQNAQTRSRARVLSAAARLREVHAPRRITPALRTAFAMLGVALFLILGGNGLLVASASSLPGEPLYAVKRGMENLQLSLASDPQEKAIIEQELYDLRIEETGTLLHEQRVERVEFSGLVESQTSNGWVVSGIPVIVTVQTELDGVITPGAHVEIRGQTQTDGSVWAERVKVESTGSGNNEDNPGSSGGEDSSGSSGSGDKTPEPTKTDADPSRLGSGGGGGDDHSGSGESTPEPTEEDDN